MMSKSAKTGGNQAPYLGNRNVQWDLVDVSELETMSFSEAERTRFSLQDGDVLICEGGDVGRTAIWRGELRECFFQKAIHRLRPLSQSVVPEFMLLFMQRASSLGWLQNYVSQTSIAHLPQEKLQQVPMLVPPREEQLQMASLTEANAIRLTAEQTTLHKLQSLKRGLSHDLLTGRVRVKP